MDISLTRLSAPRPNSVDRRDLARLIFDALPDFYSLIPLDRDAILDLITDEMESEETECYNPLVALADGELAGLICGFPIAKLDARQQKSLLHIMRRLDRASRREFRDTAKAALSVAPIEVSGGRYIARIAVSQALRGCGIGTAIFRQYVALDPASPVALHVDCDNAGAIAYYQQLGFAFCGSADFRKRAMIWGPAGNLGL